MRQRMTKEERTALRMEMGIRLRDLRKSYGFSRDELSKSLCLTVGHLGLIERGERGITAEILINITTLFQCSADYVLTGKEYPAAEIAGSRHARAIDKMLDYSSKQKLFEFIKSISPQK
ncbi:MAG: helix-turn-helix domain-containing protein [Defluviitaleaceae bacterium]|nr:helix-turn-helix domain-containing protein [Defluviitaleaceae bacterium]